jgi:hypothetical protein
MPAGRPRSRRPLAEVLKRSRVRRFAKHVPQPSRSDRGERAVGGYTNELTKLDRHEALLAVLKTDVAGLPTEQLARVSGVPREEVLGALKMLEFQGVCYSSSGGRSQLLWSSGSRPPGAKCPKLVERDRQRYLTVVSTLRSASNDRISTDQLMRLAKVPDRHRKALRGGLKALVALGHVRTGKHGRQAVVWQWVGPGGRGNLYERDLIRGDDGRVLDQTALEDAAAFTAWQARMDDGDLH